MPVCHPDTTKGKLGVSRQRGAPSQAALGRHSFFRTGVHSEALAWPTAMGLVPAAGQWTRGRLGEGQFGNQSGSGHVATTFAQGLHAALQGIITFLSFSPTQGRASPQARCGVQMLRPGPNWFPCP